MSHGELARGLLSAVQRIAGVDESVLIGLSNDGLGPDAIRRRLDEVLGEGPAVIFSDLPEGSCGLVGRKACLGRVDRLLITGVNLPMLLDFALHNHLPLDQLATRLLERGRASITLFPEVG